MKKLTTILAVCILMCSMQVNAATVKDVPTNTSFKTWMGYKAITNTSSKQYELQQKCTTDANGLRVYDGRYCIALGTYYTKDIGTYVDVTLIDGTVLPCILGDVKSDKHTDSANRQMVANGNVVEFIVDSDVLQSSAKSTGNISSIPGFAGDLKAITILSEEDVKPTTSTDAPVAVAIYTTSNVETFATR